MAATIEQFTTRFPEFAPMVDEFPGMLEACLAEAELCVSDQWGSKRDQIVLLESAHRAAITPFGRNAKLSSGEGRSTYGVQAQNMRVAFVCALGRLG